MICKVFKIEWELGVTEVQDIELSDFLIENAINDYRILEISEKRVLTN